MFSLAFVYEMEDLANVEQSLLYDGIGVGTFTHSLTHSLTQSLTHSA